MLLKIGVAVAAVPLVVMGAVAGTGVVVVDVKEAEGAHIVIPVPLMLADFAARLVPADSTRNAMRQLEQARPYLPLAEEVVTALAEAPDAELVSVDDGDEHVRISKAGDEIRIRVNGADENVAVNVPIEAVRDTLRKADHGRLYPEDLVAVLRSARMTKVVDVQDGHDHVQISVW